MNIFRIFFVSTVLIPVIVVVATSDDDSGIRIRRPTRSIVISEDGTRSARRHQPVNISDRNCPALGCTGNLTSDTFNGKGSIAATILPTASSTSSKDERFGSPEFLHHHHPLKIEIKSITNSTIANSLDSSYAHVDEETGRSDDEFPVSAFFSWAVYWGWKVISAILVFKVVRFLFKLFKIKSSIADDYIEYYVKLGQDSKHPFSSYGGGWLPSFGVSLKSKAEKGWKKRPVGWKGTPSKVVHSYYSYGLGNRHHHHRRPHSTSYHHSPPGWGWPKKQKGWKKDETSSEEELSLREKYHQTKGHKYAQKYAKKYGKKAHKYGLRPQKWSHIYDQYGNIIVGYKGSEDVATGWGGVGRAGNVTVTNSTITIPAKGDTTETT